MPDKPLASKQVAIGRRHVVRVPFTCTLTELELDGISEVDLVIDLVGDVLGVASVTFTAVAGREITSTAMRGLKVNSVMRTAVAGAMMPLGPWGFSEKDRERFRQLGPAGETLEAVAEVYEFGRMTGRPPAREVEIQLGLPRTTASKWVRRARDEGYLRSWHVTPC